MKSPLLLAVFLTFQGVLLPVLASPSEDDERQSQGCDTTISKDTVVAVGDPCGFTSSCQKSNPLAKCEPAATGPGCVCEMPAGMNAVRRRKKPTWREKRCSSYLGHKCLNTKWCKPKNSKYRNNFLQCKWGKCCCRRCSKLPGYTCKPAQECKSQGLEVLDMYYCPGSGHVCCQDCVQKPKQCSDIPGYECVPFGECKQECQLSGYVCPMGKAYVCCEKKPDPPQCTDIPGHECAPYWLCQTDTVLKDHVCENGKEHTCCKKKPPCEDVPGYYCVPDGECDQDELLPGYGCTVNTFVCCVNCTFDKEPEPPCNDTCCGDGWCQRENYCYYFSESFRNWTASASSCESMNSWLPTIESREEMDYLREAARYPYWTAINDRNLEGQFVTHGGAPITYALLMPNQPDNWIHNDGMDEDCINVVSTIDIHWVQMDPPVIAMNDERCDRVLRYVCRKPAPANC